MEALAEENRLEIVLTPPDIEIFGVELALYRDQSDISK